MISFDQTNMLSEHRWEHPWVMRQSCNVCSIHIVIQWFPHLTIVELSMKCTRNQIASQGQTKWKTPQSLEDGNSSQRRTTEICNAQNYSHQYVVVFVFGASSILARMSKCSEFVTQRAESTNHHPIPDYRIRMCSWCWIVWCWLVYARQRLRQRHKNTHAMLFLSSIWCWLEKVFDHTTNICRLCVCFKNQNYTK